MNNFVNEAQVAKWIIHDGTNNRLTDKFAQIGQKQTYLCVIYVYSICIHELLFRGHVHTIIRHTIYKIRC